MSKQYQKQFIESLTKIIDYLEEDERKDYDAFEESDAHKENHIYAHICNVREWIQEEVNPEEIREMNVIANFQQIRAEVKERNMLLASVKNIRAVAMTGADAALSKTVNRNDTRFEHIVEMCDDAIYQAGATNTGLNARNVSERSQNVEGIARYLVAQFWLGAEIGLGNSSTRDMSQEQYYELNKNEWIIKAECLIKEISRTNVGTESLTRRK